jgi:hypothetical protein
VHVFATFPPILSVKNSISNRFTRAQAGLESLHGLVLTDLNKDWSVHEVT